MLRASETGSRRGPGSKLDTSKPAAVSSARMRVRQWRAICDDPAGSSTTTCPDGPAAAHAAVAAAVAASAASEADDDRIMGAARALPRADLLARRARRQRGRKFPWEN